jgi:hypothetical protein
MTIVALTRYELEKEVRGYFFLCISISADNFSAIY